MTERHFTTGQTVTLVGIDYPTLDYWARSGFIRPSVQAAAGRGSDRLYSFRDLVALRLAVELGRLGVGLLRRRPLVQRVLDPTLVLSRDKGEMWHHVGYASVCVQLGALIEELEAAL